MATGVRGARGGVAGWDLRLAGMAVATWLSALLVLHTGALTGLVLSVAAGIAGAVLGWLPSRAGPERTSVAGAVLGVLVGVVCGAAATAARVAVRDVPVLTALAAAGESVRADVVVRDDPRPLRGDAGRPATYVIAADLRRLTPAVGGAILRLSVRVLVLANDRAWLTVLPGQSVTATGRLTPARGGDLRAAVLTVAGAPDSTDPAPWHQRAAGALRAGLQRACAPLPDAASAGNVIWAAQAAGSRPDRPDGGRAPGTVWDARGLRAVERSGCGASAARFRDAPAVGPCGARRAVVGAARRRGNARSAGANRARSPCSFARTAIWCRRARISVSLSRSLLWSSRSIANALVTPRYASRSSMGRHHRPVTDSDPMRAGDADHNKIRCGSDRELGG